MFVSTLKKARQLAENAPMSATWPGKEKYDDSHIHFRRAAITKHRHRAQGTRAGTYYPQRDQNAYGQS